MIIFISICGKLNIFNIRERYGDNGCYRQAVDERNGKNCGECKAALADCDDYDLAKFYLEHFAGLAVVVHLKKKEEVKN